MERPLRSSGFHTYKLETPYFNIKPVCYYCDIKKLLLYTKFLLIYDKS